MERILGKEQVADALQEALPALAYSLPADIRQGLEDALSSESDPRGRLALELLCKNAAIAEEDSVPICQDTGSVWCALEFGPDVLLRGDVLSRVNEVVARAYDEGALRKSLVADALFDRTNTGDNTPAFAELLPSERPGARLHVMVKGGGSDNASRVVMLPPGAGRQGVVDCVLQCVSEKAANACPPLVVGVGIGATFDKVASLAKRALMRPLDQEASDAATRAFEHELLEAINGLGIGPGALGGQTTVLGVRVLTAPCHIAALPVAVNMGCSAMRRATIEIL